MDAPRTHRHPCRRRLPLRPSPGHAHPRAGISAHRSRTRPHLLPHLRPIPDIRSPRTDWSAPTTRSWSASSRSYSAIARPRPLTHPASAQGCGGSPSCPDGRHLAPAPGRPVPVPARLPRPRHRPSHPAGARDCCGRSAFLGGRPQRPMRCRRARRLPRNRVLGFGPLKRHGGPGIRGRLDALPEPDLCMHNWACAGGGATQQS